MGVNFNPEWNSFTGGIKSEVKSIMGISIWGLDKIYNRKGKLIK